MQVRMEYTWEPKRGLPIIRFYKVGEVNHFAVFYNQEIAIDYFRSFGGDISNERNESNNDYQTVGSFGSNRGAVTWIK